MENCNTGIVISTTEEPCSGNYVSTNCTAIPNNITYLNLSAGDSQTKVNAALVTALTYKDEQIAQLPVFDGSETKIIAGANVNVTGLGTTVSPFIVTAVPPPSDHKIFLVHVVDNNVNPPVFTIIKNDLSSDITIQRYSWARYGILSTSAPFTSKAFIRCTANVNGIMLTGSVYSTNEVDIYGTGITPLKLNKTTNVWEVQTAFAPVDPVINMLLEIKVYN